MRFSFITLTAAILAGSAMASPVLERQTSANVTGLAQYTSFSNGGVTACGAKHTDSEFVLGVDAKTFGNGDAVCGRQIRIYAGGKTHKGTIVDSCGSGCGSHGLNLSPALFQKFYPLAKGQFTATWKFL